MFLVVIEINNYCSIFDVVSDVKRIAPDPTNVARTEWE
jgi:hypothetical protein